MNNWTLFAVETAAFAHTEFGRILATLFVMAIGAVAWRFFKKKALAETGEGTDIHSRRGNFVLARNLVFCFTLLFVFSIWATKIAGVALSLAAVAGAMLIVSKEFLANLLGTTVLAVSRPYRIGDFIEMGDVCGRVLDTDLLVTTLAETLEGHQITGRKVVIPNSTLLTRPVKNLTATGSFVINLLNVVVSPSDDIMEHEKALLQAAADVCRPWIAAADIHLKSIECRELVDLPSASPRVLLQLDTAKECTLALRYACRPNDRVKVEQEILRKYLRYRANPDALAADRETPSLQAVS